MHFFEELVQNRYALLKSGYVRLRKVLLHVARNKMHSIRVSPEASNYVPLD